MSDSVQSQETKAPKKKSLIADYWSRAGALPEGFEEGETTTETPIEE